MWLLNTSARPQVWAWKFRWAHKKVLNADIAATFVGSAFPLAVLVEAQLWDPNTMFKYFNAPTEAMGYKAFGIRIGVICHWQLFLWTHRPSIQRQKTKVKIRNTGISSRKKGLIIQAEPTRVIISELWSHYTVTRLHPWSFRNKNCRTSTLLHFGSVTILRNHQHWISASFGKFQWLATLLCKAADHDSQIRILW